jgi:hypothetical protein
MPVLRHDRETLEVGAYYVNVRTGTLVEIMEIDLSGNCRVLDAAADFDAPWQELSHAQISSCLWRPVDSQGESTADRPDEMPRAA